jgi:hypothetical protein
LVTVKDILFLSSLRSARIAAGNNGLKRKIRRVSFIDCPLQDITASDTNQIVPGDLYINSLYMFKNSEDDIYKLFKFYIDSQSAGSIVITEYINELPNRIIELASNHNYPVLFIDPAVPYGEIIREISALLLAESNKYLHESRIDSLLYPGVTPREVRELWDYFNPEAKRYYCTFYGETPILIDEKQKSCIEKMKEERALNCFYYKQGFFIIANEDDDHILQKTGEEISASLSAADPQSRLGISETFSNSSTFHFSIRQSLSAFEIAKCINAPFLYYRDIGIYKILYNIKDTNCLNEFCDRTLGVLIKYDRLYGTYLLNTVNAFIRLDGNYKKVAMELFQHENTIRFRISKAKKLLGLTEKHYEFIEILSIALKSAQLLHIYETENIHPSNR